jgi:hypothetical protein
MEPVTLETAAVVVVDAYHGDTHDGGAFEHHCQGGRPGPAQALDDRPGPRIRTVMGDRGGTEANMSLMENQRLVGCCAWVAAWVGLVAGQLHALSRFATDAGAEDLALPATAAWAVPAAGMF